LNSVQCKSENNEVLIRSPEISGDRRPGWMSCTHFSS